MADSDVPCGTPDRTTNLTAVKYDQGKLRYDLIPPGPLTELARVYTIGAKKYADDNWKKGMSYRRIFGAMMRHAWAWFRGESIDPENGQHHLASVAWNAFTLMYYETNRATYDDRPLHDIPCKVQESSASDPPPSLRV